MVSFWASSDNALPNGIDVKSNGVTLSSLRGFVTGELGVYAYCSATFKAPAGTTTSKFSLIGMER